MAERLQVSLGGLGGREADHTGRGGRGGRHGEDHTGRTTRPHGERCRGAVGEERERRKETWGEKSDQREYHQQKLCVCVGGGG